MASVQVVALFSKVLARSCELGPIPVLTPSAKAPTQKPPLRVALSIKNFVLAPTYSAPFGVPSAMEGLTSVFGMRTGGPPPLKHQHSILNFRYLTLTSCEMTPTECWGGRGGRIRTYNLSCKCAKNALPAELPLDISFHTI